ncbi:MAG TPA: hypothetical protein PLO61_04165 [Fimbriimonadaceae bacterium]|nr:hypothetical protein [Fimbriimonadaceae bacterium]HRJ32843.1 hypothetical protein [Fimbriimonadaceae bacterium]
MDCACPTQVQIFEELARLAPGVPLLALGQTVFWDEPMKAGVALQSHRLGFPRPFVAGVHDTDYFAKLPTRSGQGRFQAIPHNDTTTKGLWSAAAEFSTLWGSETVVTRDQLQTSGLRLAKLERARPGILDEATEAWGWRGVVSLSKDSKVTAETPLSAVFGELQRTLDWAIDGVLDSICCGDQKASAVAQAEALRSMTCDLNEPMEGSSLSDYYRRLLAPIYQWTAGESVDIETTATTELLKFNSKTCTQKRFRLLDFFIQPTTRAQAEAAYNAAVTHSEIYTLDRFGTGALPFDLVVPGKGRGTLRLGHRGLIIQTPQPLFLSLKKPVTNVSELAEVIERKFGPDCTLIGKAIPLIGMLATEHIFVFHEGGSGYTDRCRDFHQRLAAAGMQLDLHPILRVLYEPWDALQSCCTWFTLPEPFRRPFGTEELCAPSFSRRWREVVVEQAEMLNKLAELRRPIDLIEFLAHRIGGGWQTVAQNYREVFAELDLLNKRITDIKADKQKVLSQLRAAKKARVEAERAKGEHWRAQIFEKNPSPEDWKARDEWTARVREAMDAVQAAKLAWQSLEAQQEALVRDEPILEAHARRRDLELEAELKRLKLIRSAVIVSKGLPKAGHRPAAWWFPLVCTNGSWFRRTIRSAQYRLEFLN